jgi:hypothetical protein
LPAIIDYSSVQARMKSAGLVCNYHNSGAFGFSAKSKVIIYGWIGPGDATIKPTLLEQVKMVTAPYESNLAQLAALVWETVLPGTVWIMPMSHWHFELHDGSRDWMPQALQEISVDPKQLEDRADGSALEFVIAEKESFTRLLTGLFTNLRVSDFLLAFPDRPVVCMVHHHKQLWWQTTDPMLAGAIDAQFTPGQ